MEKRTISDPQVARYVGVAAEPDTVIHLGEDLLKAAWGIMREADERRRDAYLTAVRLTKQAEAAFDEVGCHTHRTEVDDIVENAKGEYPHAFGQMA